jgi:hypothetical protein
VTDLDRLIADVDELLDAEQRQGAGREVPRVPGCNCVCLCDLVDTDERDR